MAEFKQVRVMISSRCNSQVRQGRNWVPLTAVRKELQSVLEAETLLGHKLFDVWISDAPEDQSQGDLETAWEKSLDEVRRSDIILALYTGEAGWAHGQVPIGICHAEFQEAWNNGPARLKVVRVLDCKAGKKDASERSRDGRFQEYFDRLNPTSSAATTADEIIARSREALREAVAGLVKLGGREARKGSFAYGTPLDWSRMDFATRKSSMEKALGKCLASAGAAALGAGWIWPLADSTVLTICHGLPAAFGVAAAREMVGQPFLRDHQYLDGMGGAGKEVAGPLHLVACLKNVTEAQAMRQLGFPDATIVSGAFGVYVSDPVQKIQMVFLANCRDPGTTANAFGRLTEWLATTGETTRLSRNAQGRRLIVRAILDLQEA